MNAGNNSILFRQNKNHQKIKLLNNHFADDTNNLHEGPSLKDNKKMNYKSRATHWIRADIISLNVAKTETILFCLDRTKII